MANYDDSGVVDGETTIAPTAVAPTAVVTEVTPVEIGSRLNIDDSLIEDEKSKGVNYDDSVASSAIADGASDTELMSIDQQTAMSMLNTIPIKDPNLAEEIDARIQKKFEEQRDLIAASVQESEYANLAAQSQAKDLQFRVEELDKRGLTVQEAREMAAARGPDALATF